MTNEGALYHIKLKGHLAPRWQDWFDGLSITLTDEGDTILSGIIVDQAALHGVFKKIRNLGLSIVSVNLGEMIQEMTSSTHSDGNKEEIEQTKYR